MTLTQLILAHLGGDSLVSHLINEVEVKRLEGLTPVHMLAG